MRAFRWMLGAVTVVVLAPVGAQAQDEPEEPGPLRGWAGGGIEYGRATGEFASYVRDGLGLDGWLAMRLGARSPFALRMAGHALIYGSDTRRYPLLPGIDVDVTTNNTIAGLMVGPQFQAGEGALGAYVFGGVGFNYFATTSSVSGSSSTDTFASSTNFDDFTFAGEAGGGVLVRLSRKVALDLGARYIRNGEVTYVTKERITVSGNTLTLSPVTSDANLLVYHLGVTIGVTSGRGHGGKQD